MTHQDEKQRIKVPTDIARHLNWFMDEEMMKREIASFQEEVMGFDATKPMDDPANAVPMARMKASTQAWIAEQKRMSKRCATWLTRQVELRKN